MSSSYFIVKKIAKRRTAQRIYAKGRTELGAQQLPKGHLYDAIVLREVWKEKSLGCNLAVHYVERTNKRN